MQLKSFVSRFVLTIGLRFVHLFPNNDPIMACMLPESRKNMLHAALFAFSIMIVFDFFTSGIGIWTWVTAFTYAALAVLFGSVFKHLKDIRLVHYLGASVLGVVLFDLITGPGLSTIIFHQSFLFTVVAQIPFTLLHLGSAVTYTFFFVPLLDPAVREERSVLALLNPFRVLSGVLSQWF